MLPANSGAPRAVEREGKPIVLVVDDDPDILHALAFALRSRFQVLTASDGVQGITQAVEAQPHCLVIDVKMPSIDGLQLVRALRGDRATSSIPLVILSAMVQEQDQLIGWLAGADQYLTKPSKPETIIAAISEAIALGADERAARMRALIEELPENG